MQEKKYWQSYSELVENDKNGSEENSELLDDIVNTETNRRDFLKTLGFTVGAASLAASCSIPERKSIPYVNRPEGIVPGMATYYSSVFAEGGDYVSILVKNRDGRPIKIEGNKDSVISGGGTTALAQASIIGLYDSNRYQAPQIKGKKTTWSTIDKEIVAKLDAMKASNSKIAFVTPTVISPSTNSLIFSLISKYPNVEHITHDAVSYAGLIGATEASFGKRTLPDYKFENADVILSIGADFLASWINPVEYAKGYAQRRKVSKDNSNMSQHLHVESVPSPSSATSDYNFVVSPSEEARFVAELYSALTTGTSSEINGVNEVKEKLAKAKSQGKKILVVNGSNDVNVQKVTFAVNNLLGAIGSTVFVGKKVNYKKGSFADTQKLYNGLMNGDYKGMITMGANPVYSLPDNKKIKDKVKGLEFSVALAQRKDETNSLCQYICASNHFLESWNDYEPKDGVYSIAQPAISPLFDTRQVEETLMSWMSQEGTYYDFIKENAKSYNSGGKYHNFDAFWSYTLQNGESVSPSYASNSSSSFSGGDISSLIGKINSNFAPSKFELRLYETVHGDGSMADNPFIQELPDPISRMTWGNYFLIHPETAKALDAEPELNKKKFAIITATINGKKVSMPAVPTAGIAKNTLGLKFGFGRTETSNAEYNYGYNACDIQPTIGDTLSNVVLDVKVDKSAGDYEEMASVQSYFRLNHEGLGGEKTRHLIKETTLDEYKSNPEAGNTILNQGRKDWIEHHLVTLYPDHKNPGHQWGMVIDLNSCVGCGACVVACNVENNVPVVGKNEVYRSHDMHWLRIDRYHTGDVDSPDVTFQPMLCQHCDNAPCENVCPVSATNQSSEGLNQMAYNRCIGTRYCANNCPYKVRRFNWFDYTGSDSFGASNDNDPLDRNDPIARMVLNPDVVTRSRGVIEKCSFCVQRIQVGKLDAKKENRMLDDGDIVTACQSACPTNAISFGDVNNEETQVAKMSNDERAFGVIEEIYTKPSVLYLTKVRNRETENHKA